MPKSPNPIQRLGIYKRIQEVPDQYRLQNFEAEYHGRDLWSDYFEERTKTYDSARFIENLDRAGQRWKNHMRDRNQHHALALPQDVNSWMESLLDRMSWNTGYNDYWAKIERFYQWLVWHPDHPHRYNPVLMAAAHLSPSDQIWQTKMERRKA